MGQSAVPGVAQRGRLLVLRDPYAGRHLRYRQSMQPHSVFVRITVSGNTLKSECLLHWRCTIPKMPRLLQDISGMASVAMVISCPKTP
jgi:hypothetical protein